MTKTLSMASKHVAMGNKLGSSSSAAYGSISGVGRPASHPPSSGGPRRHAVPETVYEPHPGGSVVRHGRFLLNWWLPLFTVFAWWILREGIYHHHVWGLRVCAHGMRITSSDLPACSTRNPESTPSILTWGGHRSL